MNRKEIATDTLNILERGALKIGSREHNIRAALDRAVAGTQLYSGIERGLQFEGDGSYDTAVRVTNETTLEALARLALEQDDEVMCLNFASAKFPGGGFLNGAQAQEESLARSSGLYSCLLSKQAFYDLHREQDNLLYSDQLIYSPGVPVFRSDEGDLLKPYYAAFITCAAPNAGAIADNQRDSTHLIPDVFHQRASRLLGLAAAKKHKRLLLGAWGCGVFRNNPEMVARAFYDLLTNQYRGVFQEVVFAIFDRTKDSKIYVAFEEALG